jgi:hypothetical protein
MNYLTSQSRRFDRWLDSLDPREVIRTLDLGFAALGWTALVVFAGLMAANFLGLIGGAQ